MRHTRITYIAKSKAGSKEKNKSYNQIKMCMCMNCDGWNGNSFCMISLPIQILLRAWLSFFSSFLFFMDLHVPTFFSFFFLILGPSCVHIFFSLIAHASLFFNKNQRERPTHIVERLFCGMSGWYNANFSKKHSKGVYGVHVNLDHESMKRILSRVTTI